MKTTYTVSTLLADLDRAISKAGSVRKWADANGVSHVYANDVVNRDQHPGPKILRILGYAKCPPSETLYVKVK